ncbi:hypothetical protein VNO77_38944 [Canavalia gladiata]|uniref:Uncharacterized protein n=1 Tax=Canavalia gladiata TaxID=3824 RepID=A0AAN9KCQ3_CANGL
MQGEIFRQKGLHHFSIPAQLRSALYRAFVLLTSNRCEGLCFFFEEILNLNHGLELLGNREDRGQQYPGHSLSCRASR